ncbi:MAG: ATP-binding cassette domain-containing protein, partial [Actinomycetota bacterium]
LFRPLRKMSKEGGYLSSAIVSAERLMEVLELEPEPQEGDPPPIFRGDVAFEAVHFTHEGGVKALRGLSFEVPAGCLAVLAGPNGAGKSTAFSVLLRLLTPEKGNVSIDGEPIEKWRLEDYRRRFSYIPQDVQLFSGSIRENILYGRPDAMEEEIAAAAADALIDEVVDRLPNGYDEIIGEGGSTLSGGEARRLMLARAAVRNARILLFDEPFTGLDTEARATVAGAIRRIASGRTALVINHGPIEELNPDLVIEIAGGRRRGDRPPESAPIHIAGSEALERQPASLQTRDPLPDDLSEPASFGDLPRLLDDASALRLFTESGLQISGVERDFTGVWAESALVSFRFLPARGGSPIPGYVRTYANGAASSLASRWRERATGTPLGPGVRLLSGDHSVLFLFPNDDVLNGLAEASDPAFLENLLEERGRLAGPSTGVTIDYFRYRPEKRLVVRASVTGPAGAVDSAARFYARHLPAEAGRRLDRLAASLRDRSVNHVPRAVATVMDGSLFVEEAVEGLGLPDAIAGGLADPGALASALRRFHESGVKEGEMRTPESRLAESLVVLNHLGRVGELSPLCRELAGRLADALPDIAPGCLLHGDLHPNQILIARGGPFLIDLEDVAVGDPFDD